MSGRVFISVFLAFVVLFGGLLWYFQTRAFYEEVTRSEIIVAGRTLPVADYVGIDAASSGLKLRGCFEVDPALFEGVELASAPEPLTPPGWFTCFEPATIAADLAAGRAVAYLAAREEVDGIDRVVAVYADGRAFEWRQLNERYAR